MNDLNLDEMIGIICEAGYTVNRAFCFRIVNTEVFKQSYVSLGYIE